MSNRFGLGNLFHKATPETREEKGQAALVSVERLTPEPAVAELDARFREALAEGEITGDIVAVDEQGREVRSQKRSNIFDA